MTFQDLIKEFYDNPQDCINPCENLIVNLIVKTVFIINWLIFQ